jgi:ABC-2 type transport system permease protein
MLKYLLEKEFKQFFRNNFLPKLVTIFPFAILLIFPLVANMDVKNINLSIVDNDRSGYSRELIHKIASSGYFSVTNVAGTYTEALSDLEKDRSDIILEIPGRFERTLVNEKQEQVMITANAVNGMKGGLGSAYLSAILSDFCSEVRLEWSGISSGLPASPVAVIPLYRYNPTLDYKIFIIPAIMVMLMAMICGFLPCLNIVGEKENGTIEQMNVTPVGKFTLILSKLIPYWLIGFVALTIAMLVALVVYGLSPRGNVLNIYLFVSVFILGFSGFGLVISNYAKSLQQAMFMMFFFVITLVFISGLYTPINNMPGWLQTVSHFSPLKYIIDVFRLIYLKGSGFLDMIPQFLALCGFAIAFNTWAIISYKKSS